MTIQELADRADVTIRTIRYYVEQGVLPPPERGRPAEYTNEHVARLALIKRLKEQYLPLEEIRDTLQRLSLDEVEALVATYSPEQEQTQKLDSAADYIANVIDRGLVREQMKKQTLPLPPLPPSRTPASAQAATEAPEAARKRVEMPGSAAPADKERREVPQPYAEPAPAIAPQSPAAGFVPPPAPAQAPAQAPAPASASQPSLASRLWSSVVGRPGQGRASEHTLEEHTGTQAPSAWHRVQLGEGIELHYLASDDARFNQMVVRLVEAARRILDEGPGNGEERK